MNLIIDTNIVISALITPHGTISRLLLFDLRDSHLLAPHFLFDEILNKYDKILKITNLADEDLKELFYLMVKHISFVNNDLISNENQKEAYEIVKNIDKKDLLFVALSLQTGFPIWSGDLKLVKGLRERGFNNIIETKELIEKLN